MYDWLVVGAGFAGSVMAERIASQRGATVMVIDQRPHIAGNAFDRLDKAGVLIHEYGPHIFHTNAPAIVDYLSQFTRWRQYEHRVLAMVDGKAVPIPINRTTINQLYGLTLTEAEVPEFLTARRLDIADIKTSEDVVLSTVGRDLYEKFFRGYTRKQWGLDPSELDKSVTARIPTRVNDDDRYFTDTFQQMPAEGYTRMFERMLDHPNIDMRLGTTFAEAKAEISYKRLIYTGPIDEYFGYCFGKLPYRSLRFVHQTIDAGQVQPVATINYPQTEDYTRITEFKHLTGQQHQRTSVVYEYPSAVGDPYYPIPREENFELYRQYDALARKLDDVWFVGRLANYRYFNMDQVVGQALATFGRLPAKVAERDMQPARQADAGTIRPLGGLT